MSNQTSSLLTLVQSLQKTFNSNLYTSLPRLLSHAKILLSTNNLLTPTPKTSSTDLQLSRKVFEIGAYTSILLKDKASFVNYIGYLQNFYSLGQGGENEPELTGLNLLRLLAENKIAEFHTQLEIIEATAKSVAESGPVKFARGLEEWVMEGAYNQVWKAGEGKGVSVYQKFFLDVPMDTIRYVPCQHQRGRLLSISHCRNEIATCLERAYPSLPISDTQILLFFPPQDHVGFKSFAETVYYSLLTY
jgi:26S proteasome regulatory subunit N12